MLLGLTRVVPLVYIIIFYSHLDCTWVRSNVPQSLYLFILFNQFLFLPIFFLFKLVVNQLTTILNVIMTSFLA